MSRKLLVSASLLTWATACSQTWKPPDPPATPAPMVDVLTPNGWVSMPSNQAAEYPVSGSNHPAGHSPRLPPDDRRTMKSTDLEGYESVPYRPPAAWSIPKPTVESVGPVSPQYYYVRPEQDPSLLGRSAPMGLSPGRYGRIDNFTPGEQTPHGYEPGHYRGEGVYTRPEYTPHGFSPGNWRAEPLPSGRALP